MSPEPPRGERWHRRELFVSRDVNSYLAIFCMCHNWFLRIPVADLQSKISFLQETESLSFGEEKKKKERFYKELCRM